MSEVGSVADSGRAGVFGEHLIAPIVFHGGANVETFVAAVVPRSLEGCFVVNEHVAAGQADCGGIKIVWAKEVFICRCGCRALV